jgi:hypothetical protein
MGTGGHVTGCGTSAGGTIDAILTALGSPREPKKGNCECDVRGAFKIKLKSLNSGAQ